MKKKIYLSLLTIFFACNFLIAQVKTSFGNETPITQKGVFERNYKLSVDFELPALSIDSLLEVERRSIAASNEARPFQFAKATPLNLNIAKQLVWANDRVFSYGKYTIRLNGALSTSLNFDQFYLPPNTEMFIYNQDGSIVTGPITEKRIIAMVFGELGL
jgi:lysyl endopeptidase